MKCIVWAAGAWLLLLLSGCSTGPFAKPVAEERLFEVGPDAVFAEARALLEARGYRIQQARPASGSIEALSPLQLETGLRQATQRRIRIVVTEEGPGQSRVSMIAWEAEESESPIHGRSAFERPLRDPGFYNDLFEQLGERLGQ